MSTSEIAKLESRWRDNPQGLTFAPLAEAYRKQKDPRRALDILLPGLERHPDYIPANIVLGRCHWDLSDLDAAESAFRQVLALDAENVIALKALADITERQSRPHEAERWLETLLSVDRSNDEAREQLARIRAVQSVSPAVETPAGLDELTDEPAAPPRAEPVEPAPEPALLDVGYSPRLDPFPAIADRLPPIADRVAAPESESAGEEREHTPAAFGYAGGEGKPDDEPEPEPVAAQRPFEPPEPFRATPTEPEGLALERAEDIVLNVAGRSEFHGPSAADELIAAPGAEPGSDSPAAAEAADAGPTRDILAEAPPPVEALFGSYEPEAVSTPDQPATAEAPSPEPPAYERPMAESLPAGEPVGAAPPDAGGSSGEAYPPDTAEPDLVVTETMAQVFLRQGYVVEALAVYRELVARDPAAAHLRERVVELEARQEAAAAPPPRPSILARDTGGQSLGSFLAGVLAARLEPPPGLAAGAADAETAPEAAPATRPAEEPLSLGSVFGEDPPAVAPAVPPVGAAPAETSGGGAAPGVSFDEFFAGSPVSAPAPAPRPSRPKSDDDLDQFHSWLQSLKR